MNTIWRCSSKMFAGLLLIIMLMSCVIQTSAEEINDTYINSEYQNYCVELGKEYEIQPEILMAIIEYESSGRPFVENGNCVGLMQVNKYHAQELGFDPYDPYQNIEAGIQILYEKRKICLGDIAIALALYHGEKKALNENYQLSPYVTKVLNRSAELEILHYGL